MTAKPTRRGRTRLQPWVSTELVQRLEALAASRGVTETSLLEESLRQYLDGTLGSALILRQMSLHSRKLRNVHRDIELLAEGFGTWVKIMFAHLAPIADDRKQAARQLAENRYRSFVDHVAEHMGGGKRFLDDLPREGERVATRGGSG